MIGGISPHASSAGFDTALVALLAHVDPCAVLYKILQGTAKSTWGNRLRYRYLLSDRDRRSDL